MKELFNMANCNTMLALAYIQESENPYRLFAMLYNIAFLFRQARN